MTIHIKAEHILMIENQIHNLLIKSQIKMDDAYTKNENELTIAFSVKMAPCKKGDGTDVLTGINFVESRIKESLIATVPDRQKPLFPPGTEVSITTAAEHKIN